MKIRKNFFLQGMGNTRIADRVDKLIYNNRQVSIDVDMDDLFEDEEYGKKLLGVVRRGTTDTIDYHAVSLDATPDEKTVLVEDEKLMDENIA